jgi:hypothetical protein
MQKAVHNSAIDRAPPSRTDRPAAGDARSPPPPSANPARLPCGETGPAARAQRIGHLW